MREINLEFYVLNYDINAKKVYMHNIFRNICVYEATVKEVKKHLRNKKKYPYEEFKKELLNIISWQERGRREYEISVADAFETDVNKFEKWDCALQAEPNIEFIADMVIKRYKEYLKKKKD